VDLDGGLGPYAHALAFEVSASHRVTSCFPPFRGNILTAPTLIKLAQAKTDLLVGLFESCFSSSSSSSASQACRSLSMSVRLVHLIPHCCLVCEWWCL
jgi:hypothetical protein